jgi:hypothetical protein
MKLLVKISICLAGGLALSASSHAESIPLTGNPYAPVVERNIFGLNPPAPVDSNPAPVEPPLKITPNGIMSIFGQVKVLFKVAGKTPGKEESYMLMAGQAQDDIEVVKIDEKKGVVTFNNHGLEQVLPLAAPGAGSITTAAGGNPGAPGGIPAPGGNFGSSGFNNAFGARIGTSAAIGNPSAGSNPNLRAIPTRNNTFNAASQIPEGMTPEVQTIAIEANRELTKQQVINGDLPPLPITPLTPSDAVGPGGAPLEAPAPNPDAP